MFFHKYGTKKTFCVPMKNRTLELWIPCFDALTLFFFVSRLRQDKKTFLYRAQNLPSLLFLPIKEKLQIKTEYKPCRIWLSIKLVKIANLEFYCSLKMDWQPVIWPPTMKYLALTPHFSGCFSRRGLASTAYNYYSQLVYYSKTFRLGYASLFSILKAPSGR